MAKISIIIPVYNDEKYLKIAIDSVVHQTFKDLEIICIDDCSTDNSLQILEEYATQDNRFKIIKHENNYGIGISRNDGLKHATADYIMFLDSDDWYDLNACELAYKQISKNNDDICFFNSKRCDENGNFIKMNAKLSPFKDYLDGQTFSLKDIKKDFINGKIACWTRIYNREFLLSNNILFPETKRAEDIEFSIKLYLTAQKLSVLNFPLYNYRSQPQKHFDNDFNTYNDVYINLNNSYNLIIQKEDNEYILKHFLSYIINMCLMYYLECKNRDTKTKHKIYSKSRNILKRINKTHRLNNIHKKIDILQYKLFLICPSYFIFDILHNYLLNKTTIEKNHIVINIYKIKIKLKI